MTAKIAITTGGGDAPGLNAVIYAAATAAKKHGWECVGIRDGYEGLLNPARYPWGGLVPLTDEKVRGISDLGGTIIGTTNRGSPLEYPMQKENGEWHTVDRGQEVVDKLKGLGFDALVAIGGDGSLTIAQKLHELGLKVVGVPKTIDNDLDKTAQTFGYATAVEFATTCIDRLHSTAESHGRIMVVEVMGRYAGWIALSSGVACIADVILLPEIPYKLEKVAEKVKAAKSSRGFSMVVVAEGCRSELGELSIMGKKIGQAEKLGGIGERMARAIEEMTGHEARAVTLGHLLRGGVPTAMDRLLALRFGAAAIRALSEGNSGIMVALDPPHVKYVPLLDVAGRSKMVPLDCEEIRTARDLGISFGE